MAKLIYALLLLAVWYGGVKGDAACFLLKMTQCSQQLSVKISPEEHDFILCKVKDELFKCIRDGAEECSVGQRYNFDHQEKIYDDFCRDGSKLNMEMKKHKECIFNSIISSLTCGQAIIDYAKNIKEFTPDVMKELAKISCRERTNINNCYYDNIEKKCGEAARIIFSVYTVAADRVNELICKDILNE